MFVNNIREEKKMKKLYGVTIAMVTPLDAQEKPDLEAVKDLTEKLIAKGVHCLYPCGTTGEMLKLTLEERKAVAETVIKTAAGRVRVYIHVGADNAEHSLELAKHAHGAGADGVGIVTPQFFGCTPREMTNYYDEIASNLPDDFPIYMYGIPQCAANDILPEVAKDLFNRHPNIVGMKYSFLDMDRTNAYLDISPEFSVLHGCDRLFTSMLILGCEGTVSGVGGVMPEPFVHVYNAYQAGDLETAKKWQKAGREICTILKNGSNMAIFKAALEYRGVKAGQMRKPQMALPQEEVDALNAQLAEYFAKWGIDRKL